MSTSSSIVDSHTTEYEDGYTCEFYGEVVAEVEETDEGEITSIALSWNAWGEGDKDGPGPVGDVLELAASTFPPGSRLYVYVPTCPECYMGAPAPIDGYECYGGCGFDWKEWAANEYA